MCNVDALNHLPLPLAPEQVPIPGDVLFVIHHLSEHVVTAKHLKQWIDKTPFSCVDWLKQVGKQKTQTQSSTHIIRGTPKLV